MAQEPHLFVQELSRCARLTDVIELNLSNQLNHQKWHVSLS